MEKPLKMCLPLSQQNFLALLGTPLMQNYGKSSVSTISYYDWSDPLPDCGYVLIFWVWLTDDFHLNNKKRAP